MLHNLLGAALSVPIAAVGYFLFGSRTTVCQCNFEAASETSLEVVSTLKSQLARCGPEHLGAVCQGLSLERALFLLGLTAFISFAAGWRLGRSTFPVTGIYPEISCRVSSAGVASPRFLPRGTGELLNSSTAGIVVFRASTRVEGRKR